jgi:uncharacterized membrane protein YoaK (UPF0700 family)
LIFRLSHKKTYLGCMRLSKNIQVSNFAELVQHLRPALDSFIVAVTLREIFVENFAGDLEYHPRRAVAYLALAVSAFCFWIFSRSDLQFTTVPLVFALGSLAS